MATNLYRAIALLYPDSTKYQANYEQLTVRLNQLDTLIYSKLSASNVRMFIIHHPALTYYARHYGLTQIAIEHDGKEPSVAKLKELIATAKEEKIKKVFYQRQFSAATVRSIAEEIGASVVEIDPLKEDAVENLLYITHQITEK
ncbi:hypothetical protein FACS1894159_08740 [Bacteroidia bacterium]|nr:hypothetical protein FACS1894159_08740 [Bacteroidia bacterium]